MNYLDLAKPWLEWESELIAEDQHNCYINGQNDALTGEKPQEPDNQSYMMGWEETMKKIATGEIKPPTHLELNSRRGMRCHVPAGIEFQQGRQWKAGVHSAPELLDSNYPESTADEEF